MRKVSVIVALVATLGAKARAEVWVVEDAEGFHFSLIRPPGPEGRRYHALINVDRRGWPVSGPRLRCGVPRVDRVRGGDNSPERYTRYDAFIAEAARNYGVEEAVIRAVIKAESDFSPRVVSCAGAKGLMQIMPEEEPQHLIRNVFDPRQNILGGTKMLRERLDRYRGELALVAASYNAGAGAVAVAGGIPRGRLFVGGKWRNYGDGVLNYAAAVVRWYQRFKELGPEAPLRVRGR